MLSSKNFILKYFLLSGPKISKNDTRLRKAIPAAERLALTLRFWLLETFKSH